MMLKDRSLATSALLPWMMMLIPIVLGHYRAGRDYVDDSAFND